MALEMIYGQHPLIFKMAFNSTCQTSEGITF